MKPIRNSFEQMLQSDSLDDVTKDLLGHCLRNNLDANFLTQVVTVKNYSSDERSAALWILGHSESYETVPAIQKVLVDSLDNPDVRAEAARNFALLASDPFEALVDLVQNEAEPTAVRASALWGIGYFHIDDSRVITLLIHILDSTPELFDGSKSLAIDLLGSADASIQSVRIAAIGALSSQDPEVLFHAINSVCQLGLTREAREGLEALRGSDLVVAGWGSISEKADECLKTIRGRA